MYMYLEKSTISLNSLLSMFFKPPLNREYMFKHVRERICGVENFSNNLSWKLTGDLLVKCC